MNDNERFGKQMNETLELLRNAIRELDVPLPGRTAHVKVGRLPQLIFSI